MLIMRYNRPLRINKRQSHRSGPEVGLNKKNFLTRLPFKSYGFRNLNHDCVFFIVIIYISFVQMPTIPY